MFAVRPHQEAVRHGGGLKAASIAHPDINGPWLDLSTGINPEPYQGHAAPLSALGRLPDPFELQELERVAAAFFLTTPDRVAAAPGAEAIIRLLPVLLGKSTIDVVGPTYGTHTEIWQAAQLAPLVISADKAASSRADILVIVNPNNPDGYRFQRDELLKILSAREAQNRWLVVDESFGECVPELSMSNVVSDRLIVLRSFGKFFGLAGVRLGFALASPDFKAALRTLTGDWPVSADAIALGSQAYADNRWISQNTKRLLARSKLMAEILEGAGFEMVGGTSLFLLTRHTRAQDWFWTLCRRGILTRPFDHADDLLRFGLPSEADLPRLRHALAAGI